MCLDNFAYFCIVLCILLIISGVKQNPGPSLSESSRSFSSVSDLSSDCSFFKNNVSFLHLNVQSIVPQLDIITAEYSSYDILSFTESWLKQNINDETLKLPGYKFPPISDETDKIRREVELLSMLRNTLIVLSDLIT